MAGTDGQHAQCASCHAAVPAQASFCPHCGAGAVGAPAPELLGYRLLRPLGQGGSAVVYLAQQESLDRPVAVKVLRRDVDDPRAWRQFRREARTVAQLSGHPNVVTVHTAGRSDAGHPYLVTEYLDRGSLADVIEAEGPLPPAAVATVGAAIADALGAAHRLGILHRDVKPGNVLLDRHGHVKLGDFGIARLLAAQSVTTTDVIAFTPEHVAPEILRGEPDGPWSDVYGLASTLATALTGTPPFTRRPDERVEALLSRKLTGPAPELPAEVPPALADVLARALDPEPAARPSLVAFRRDLAAAGRELGASVPLPPPSPPTVDSGAHATRSGAVADAPGGGEPRRSRAGLLAVPAVVLAVLAGGLAVAVAANDGGDGGGGGAAPTASAPAVTDQPAVTGEPAPSTGPSEAAPPTGATPTDPPATEPAPTEPPAQAPTPTDPSAAPATTAVTSPPEAAAPNPPTPGVEPVALVTAPEAETFLRDYHDALAAGDYGTSWSQLAPEFQSGKARSFEYYVGFWEENDLEVGDVELVASDAERAVVNAELRWNGASRPVIDQFTLRPGEDGRLLIAEQQTID